MNDDLAQALAGLFDKDAEEIPAILDILDTEERKQLVTKLQDDTEFRNNFNLSDIEIKARTLDTLIVILTNNQRLSQSIHTSSNESPLKKLYKLAYELNKVLFFEGLETEQSQEEKLSRLKLCSIYGFLADRHSEVSPFIEKYLDLFTPPSEQSSVRLNSLTYSLDYLLLVFIKVVRTNLDKQVLLDQQASLKANLDRLQNSQLNELETDPSIAYVIGAIGNIIYIQENVLKYLFTGSIDESENVYSVVRNYSYNAIKLFRKAELVERENEAHILMHFFEQACRNSVWNIADRSPILADFFKNCIDSTNNLLYTFLPPQRDNILDILTVKKSVVINMPTSAGKSLLAELYILFTLYSNADTDNPPTVCYIVPTNALINQVKAKLTKNFEGLDYRVDGVFPSFEIDPIEDEILTRNHIHVIVSTPEKLDSLIRKDHKTTRNLKLVIMDEAHNLSSKDRGAKMELLLSIIKRRKADTRFLLMSPFIDNAQEIAEWLGDTEQDSLAISYEWTPTKQFVGNSLIKNSQKQLSVEYHPSPRDLLIKEKLELNIANTDRGISSLTGLNPTESSIVLLCHKYKRIGNTLVLCKGVTSTEKLAVKILSYFKERGQEQISSQPINDLVELIKLELGEESILAECVKYGIAFHHSQLPSIVKEELEELIKSGDMKVVCATTTLAQGMNFPITTVIFCDLVVGGGESTKEIDSQLFWNIAGRAGRAYMDVEGHIILLHKSSKPQRYIRNKTKKYIKKDLEVISSSLKNFFENIGTNTEVSMRMLEADPAVSNFLQYLNHLIRVSHNYEFNAVDLIKIRSMLSNSLAFNEIEFEEGFMEAQQQIVSFSRGYINRMSQKSKGELKLADLFGISDISLSRFYGLVSELRKELASRYGEENVEANMQASNLILSAKSEEKLSEIIKILSSIPELKVYIQGSGSMNTESIARVIIGWVNGESVNQIASAIRYEGQTVEDVAKMCHRYINGRLKTFIPWGVSIYQNITNDIESDDAKNLPSYIYFGVRDKDSVVLSAAGVPRFAVSAIDSEYKRQYGSDSLQPKNIDQIKKKIKNLDLSNIRIDGVTNQTLKRLIDKKV